MTVSRALIHWVQLVDGAKLSHDAPTVCPS